MTDERDAYPRRVLGCSGLMFIVTLFRELEKQIRLQEGTGDFIRPPFSLFAVQMTKAILKLGFATGSPRKGRHQEGDPSSKQLKTKKKTYLSACNVHSSCHKPMLNLLHIIHL